MGSLPSFTPLNGTLPCLMKDEPGETFSVQPALLWAMEPFCTVSTIRPGLHVPAGVFAGLDRQGLLDELDHALDLQVVRLEEPSLGRRGGGRVMGGTRRGDAGRHGRRGQGRQQLPPARQDNTLQHLSFRYVGLKCRRRTPAKKIEYPFTGRTGADHI